MACQKTEDGSFALVKRSDCTGSGLSPGESPLLHSVSLSF